MLSAAAVRVLSLLGATYAFNAGIAPPNPPASDQERESYSKENKDTLVLPINVMVEILRLAMNSWTVAETLTLAARNLPLQAFVSRLSPGGHQLADVLRSMSTANLRMSTHTTIGLGLLLAGAFGRVWCYRRLAKHFRFELSLQKDHKLIKEGPYAIVRHPSYTAALLLFVGAGMLDLGPGSLFGELGGFSTGAKWFGGAYLGYLLVFFIPVFKRCVVEDQVLKTHFREEWDAWAKKTPYRMIPYVF